MAVGAVFANAATNGTDAWPADRSQYTPPAGGGSSAVPPDLTVDVSASSATTPAVGGELDFYITVSTKNIGGSSSTRLELTLPQGWTYKSSFADRGPGCTGTPPTLRCDTGWINPSVRTHVTLFGTVAQQSDMTLVATIRSLQEPEANPANDSTSLKLSLTGTTTQKSPPPPTPSKPAVKLAVPVVTGRAAIGGILRITPRAGLAYQWQVCAGTCRAIKGATRPTLKLTRAFVGHSVRIVVIANGKSKASKKIAVKLKLR